MISSPGIGWQQLAKLMHAALGAGDQDLVLAAARPASAARRGALPLAARASACATWLRHAVAQRDVGQQRFQARVAVLGQVGIEALGRHAVERGVERLQRAVEHAVAELHRVLVLQLLELVADRGARLARDHELQPLRLGRGRLGGDDLHALAAGQLGAQRHQLPVHARGHRVVADVGVHRVGEIERGGIARQRQDVALGREQVDLVREQVDLDVLQELQRRAGRRAAIPPAR